jgi:hypothetical protein
MQNSRTDFRKANPTGWRQDSDLVVFGRITLCSHPTLTASIEAQNSIDSDHLHLGFTYSQHSHGKTEGREADSGCEEGESAREPVEAANETDDCDEQGTWRVYRSLARDIDASDVSLWSWPFVESFSPLVSCDFFRQGDALKGVKGATASAKKEDKKAKQFDLHPSVNKHESRDDHHHHHDQPHKPSKDDALAEELLSAEMKRKEEHRH